MYRNVSNNKIAKLRFFENIFGSKRILNKTAVKCSFKNSRSLKVLLCLNNLYKL